jgi:hopanoid biosynthesis associated RND transporter like protein HpnN
MILSRLLVGLVECGRRNALAVLLGGVVLAVLSGALAGARLGVTTDTDRMFAASLPWRQQAVAFDRAFPQFTDLLVAVIDAATPETADATAAALAERLAADKTHFVSVRRPDASAYFDREGLLLLDKTALQGLMDGTIDAQPFLGQLVVDPSARGLFASMALLGVGVTQGQADLGPYLPALENFHRAMAGALAGHPTPLSWDRLLGGGASNLQGKFHFVLIQPKLDYGALEPGGAATAAVRAAIAGLEFVKAGAAHVRITGAVALADEEFATVAHGVLAGLVVSVLLITLWLFLAVRSWRLIVPILATLGLGLMLTLGFAALAVGTLNLISVGFGILFVGIAVDFAIQFCVRYREARFQFADQAEALAATARRAGGQILIAAAATAAGFLAFVPTDFAGVAELGLIAGVGMLIAFVCTLCFLPAVITLCRPAGEPAEVGFAWAARLDPLLARRRRSLLGAFAGIFVLALAVSPRLGFDSDPLHTKDPTTEAMVTLNDLMASPLTNPYSIDVLAPDLDQAGKLAEKLDDLTLVGDVLTLDSFVPTEQDAKLAIIADAASVLGATLAPRDPAAPVNPEQIRMAAATALAQIEPALAKLPQDHPLAVIADDLKRLVVAPDAILLAMQDALTRFLPGTIERLRTALAAKKVTRADIPPEIARDWVLPDGRARVQVLAKSGALDSQSLSLFVAQVRTVAPEAGGSAVEIVESANTIVGAFRSAAIGALVAITAILFVALRRPLDVAVVLAPLLLSGAMTVLVCVVTGLQLNFANIIALPLLLGLGVSFNIYFVMNWRAGQHDVLGSATARAVIFSALTTATAFGSLAASRHPGTASMGTLLLISLCCTLVASLVFVPALLASLGEPGDGPDARRR